MWRISEMHAQRPSGNRRAGDTLLAILPHPVNFPGWRWQDWRLPLILHNWLKHWGAYL